MTPLPILGVIYVVVTYGEKKVPMRFHVTKGSTGTLLSCNTLEDFGLVSFMRQVHDSHAGAILRDFPQLFEGLGKEKGKQFTLHIDKTVKPIAL